MACKRADEGRRRLKMERTMKQISGARTRRTNSFKLGKVPHGKEIAAGPNSIDQRHRGTPVRFGPVKLNSRKRVAGSTENLRKRAKRCGARENSAAQP